MAQMVFMKTFSHQNSCGAITLFQPASQEEFSWRRPPPPRCSADVKLGRLLPALLEKTTETDTEQEKSGRRGQRSFPLMREGLLLAAPKRTSAEKV